MRKDCGNIADTMWNTGGPLGGPAADATSECTPGPGSPRHNFNVCVPERGSLHGNEAKLLCASSSRFEAELQAPVESVDKKKGLPTGKAIARGNSGFHCTFVESPAPLWAWERGCLSGYKPEISRPSLAQLC